MPPDTPETILSDVIAPALALLPPRMDSPRARLLLLAICGQEAAFKHRRQLGGPARSLWQFEKNGGVKGVLTHPASRGFAEAICAERGLGDSPTLAQVYTALEFDDILAACFARLLLWTDPAPLPNVGAETPAWEYYLRNWRPGKPHPNSWPANYRKATNAVFSEA
jgi:hypothetical protein